MKIDLHGRVAIVTGGGQGIGAEIARTLAAAGAKVAVNDINPDRAERTAAAIRGSGGVALAIGADVANKFQCVTIVETTREAWGQLDILINNAAVAPFGTILKLDEYDWQRCLDVNLKGAFFMSQLTGRVMSDENGERGGVIVNIGSTAGVDLPLAGRAAYCASKAGLTGFARECAREYAAYNIRVNTVLPGLVDPPTLELPRGDQPNLEMIPAGRLGTAADVAQTVLFLCADASAYLTGQTITVDGGRTMR